VKQQYLPDELVGKRYYNPTTNGYENKIINRLEFLRNGSDEYE
jgi:putative ATPase